MQEARSLAAMVHDDVIKWKHFPHYWPFVRGIHRTPANSPHKGQWHGILIFSLICTPNKLLSKQSWGWWFEMPSRPLWRHRNERLCLHIISFSTRRFKLPFTLHFSIHFDPHFLIHLYCLTSKTFVHITCHLSFCYVHTNTSIIKKKKDVSHTM